MVTQTDISLADGDVEKIISDEEANQTYIVEVTGSNALRIDHNKRYAPDGTTLSAGQSHTVSNLRGKELYAAAHDGATAFRVRRAAADVEAQPPQEVAVVEGDLTVQESSYANVGTQTVTGSGSFTSESVPAGATVVYRADPGNNQTVELSGFPLDPGAGVALAMSDVANVSVTANDSSDETHAIYETN